MKTIQYDHETTLIMTRVSKERNKCDGCQWCAVWTNMSDEQREKAIEIREICDKYINFKEGFNVSFRAIAEVD